MKLNFAWKLIKIMLFIIGCFSAVYGLFSFFTLTYNVYAGIMASGIAAIVVSLFMVSADNQNSK